MTGLRACRERIAERDVVRRGCRRARGCPCREGDEGKREDGGAESKPHVLPPLRPFGARSVVTSRYASTAANQPEGNFRSKHAQRGVVDPRLNEASLETRVAIAAAIAFAGATVLEMIR